MGWNDQEARHALPEVFSDELDSAFGTSIACCDQCHDDFVAMWPLAYDRDGAAFQRGCMSVDWFYECGRLSQIFTPEEFAHYRGELTCERCGSPLGANIWAYELPFSAGKDFERDLLAVSNLARDTPFLLLEHSFARDVLSKIKAVSNASDRVAFGTTLARGRVDDGTLSGSVEEFEAPPPRVTREGRYNHAGMPVLYAASDLETCFEELGRRTSLISSFHLRDPIKVLDLCDPDESHPGQGEILAALAFSALLSSPQPDDGWDKPSYIFSRFVADCARAAGFDAIKYPSVKSADRFNLVLIRRGFRLSTGAVIISVEKKAAP